MRFRDIDVTVRRLVKYLSLLRLGEGGTMDSNITGTRKRTAADRKSRAVQLAWISRGGEKRKRGDRIFSSGNGS